MTKLKNPLASLSASGSLGKILSFRSKGKQSIAERTPIPIDAKTAVQLSWRHMFLKAIALWNALSSAEKQEWESLARRRHMTGQAWFISQCLKPNPGIYLPLQGGTMQGDIDMAGFKILALPDPTAAQEAATKAYVDTSIDTDIATHAALTTGIHGVGANFIAESSVEDLNLAFHEDRHNWLGADELYLNSLIANLVSIHHAWLTHDAWTETLVNSGSVSWDGPLRTRLITGATINSRAAIYTGISGGISPHTYHKFTFFQIQKHGISLADSTIWLIALRTGEAMPPTDNSRLVGFKIVNGQIWAWTGDGAAHTATDTGIHLTATYAAASLTIEGTTGSAKFYVNNVLKATHTTNLPTAWNYRLYKHLTNEVAADRQIRLTSFNYTV